MVTAGFFDFDSDTSKSDSISYSIFSNFLNPHPASNSTLVFLIPNCGLQLCPHAQLTTSPNRILYPPPTPASSPTLASSPTPFPTPNPSLLDLDSWRLQLYVTSDYIQTQLRFFSPLHIPSPPMRTFVCFGWLPLPSYYFSGGNPCKKFLGKKIQCRAGLFFALGSAPSPRLLRAPYPSSNNHQLLHTQLLQSRLRQPKPKLSQSTTPPLSYHFALLL